MAFGVLPEKGSRYAPCEPSCEHRDCASTRRMAEGSCRLCGKQVGYGARVYQDPETDDVYVLVHANCLEDEIDRERAAR